MAYQRPSILIIDDSQAICEILSVGLTERGYQCTEAYDGAGALAKLGITHFDVVLLDVRLPDMSGMEVLAKIRSYHPAIETIMVTVVDDARAAVDAIKLGAMDYLVKPVNLDRLDTNIRTTMKIKGRPEITEGENLQLFSTGGPGKSDDTDVRSLNMMNAIARGVVARYDSLIGYSKIVMQETTRVARQCGIDESVIQKWMELMAEQSSAEQETIESGLNKLSHSPIAQEMLGLTVRHQSSPEVGNSKN